jgi:hypothetical protein
VSVEEFKLNDPQVLYLRWEDSQWSPFTIDLLMDRRHWRHRTPAPAETSMRSEQRAMRSARSHSAA